MRTILNIGHRKARGRPLTMFFSTVFLCAMLITPASISYAGTTIGDKDGGWSGGSSGTQYVLSYHYDSGKNAVAMTWSRGGRKPKSHTYTGPNDNYELPTNNPVEDSTYSLLNAIAAYCNTKGATYSKAYSSLTASYYQDGRGVWRSKNDNSRVVIWFSSDDLNNLAPAHKCTYSNWAYWTADEHEYHSTCTLHPGYVGQYHAYHEYDGWSKWTDDGNGQHYRTRTCKDCGYVDTDRKAHDWGPWIDDKNGHAATNNPDSKLASGTHHRVCSTCGRKEVSEHEMGEAKVVEVKGETAGKKTVVYRRDCAKCPHKEFIEVTMKKKGTESKEWVVDGDAKTYSEDGCKSENYIKAHELQGVPTNTARSVIKGEDTSTTGETRTRTESERPKINLDFGTYSATVMATVDASRLSDKAIGMIFPWLRVDGDPRSPKGTLQFICPYVTPDWTFANQLSGWTERGWDMSLCNNVVPVVKHPVDEYPQLHYGFRFVGELAKWYDVTYSYSTYYNRKPSRPVSRSDWDNMITYTVSRKNGQIITIPQKMLQTMDGYRLYQSTLNVRIVPKSANYWYAYPVESITNVSDHLVLHKEGHYVPTYKITDRYGELPDTTMNTELVDHSAPQMIVAVNKNGMINGAKGTMNAGHKFVMAPNEFTRMETAWTNEKPTFLIQATDTLRDSTEPGIGVGKVTIVEVTPNKDGSIPKTSAKVVAELPLNGKTTDTVTWTPPNKSDVEGSRIYLFFASDKLTRTETLQTNALYNLYLQNYNGVANGLWNVKYPYQYEASKNADAGKVKDYYDSAASKAYGYDILHTMAAQVVTHCDFTGPTVKVLSEHKITSNSIYSPHQQISIKLYDGQNIENDRSDLARFQLIGIKGDNTEDVIAESTIHDVTDDPYRLTVQEGGFHGDERKGMGLTWTDGQVLPAGSIVSAHMDDANTVTHTQEVFGRIEFDNKRNPVNQSQTLYKAFKVRAWDKVGNHTETYPIITGSQVTSQIRDAIDRSSYK